jgi:organic hydroperoxide reductase OsmC/OhrA
MKLSLVSSRKRVTVEFQHSYEVSVEWLGNHGTGTSDYKAYGREHAITAPGKPRIDGSADRAFRGDTSRWNPEEMLLAALSQCHLLSYLHVAATNGIVVTSYTDAATGSMLQTGDGGGHFTEATLHPVVTIAGGDATLAESLHHEASEKCFIASSVNFPVHHDVTIIVERGD